MQIKSFIQRCFFAFFFWTEGWGDFIFLVCDETFIQSMLSTQQRMIVACYSGDAQAFPAQWGSLSFATF